MRGPAYLAADFAFTNHWISTDRTAVGNHLTADFNAQSYGGRLEGGYRYGMLYGGITPYAAIQAQSFHTPGFTETDVIANGFGLAFGSRDATDTRSELGTRFDRVLAVYSNAVLALRGRVAWAHDWVSDATLLPVCSWLCAAPMAKRPSAALRSMGQARTAGARGRRCRCAASWSWPPSPKPVEDALEPFALLLGRLAPDRARRHVADELALSLAQALIALLAPQRDLVPGRHAVDVGEVRHAVVLVLGRAQAGVIAGVVELPHLSFG